MANTKKEQTAALDRLRVLLPIGSTVWHVTRSVSRSGMSRRVDFYAFHCDGGQPAKLYLTGYIAKAVGYTWSDKGIATYSADEAIYNLSYKLFGVQAGMQLRAERI